MVSAADRGRVDAPGEHRARAHLEPSRNTVREALLLLQSFRTGSVLNGSWS